MSYEGPSLIDAVTGAYFVLTTYQTLPRPKKLLYKAGTARLQAYRSTLYVYIDTRFEVDDNQKKVRYGCAVVDNSVLLMSIVDLSERLLMTRGITCWTHLVRNGKAHPELGALAVRSTFWPNRILSAGEVEERGQTTTPPWEYITQHRQQPALRSISVERAYYKALNSGQ